MEPQQPPTEIPAKVSAKGQITIPKDVRDALGIKGGEEVVFRIEAQRAVVARSPDLLGSPGGEPQAKPTPSPRRVPWDAARHPSSRRDPSKGRSGAVVVRDTDGSALTVELIDTISQPSRR